jgi:predicted nucleic acid-binding protein
MANQSRLAFWDTSAIIPLCCLQPQTQKARHAFRLFPRTAVWWATRVECSSGIYRLERDGELSTQQVQQSLQTLEKHRQYWGEVAPLDEVRNLAERLLRTHPLRAADSLQLAAALVWCNSLPKGRAFVCGDGRLSEAAEKEGFNVIRV